MRNDFLRPVLTISIAYDISDGLYIKLLTMIYKQIRQEISNNGGRECDLSAWQRKLESWE